MAGPAIKDLDVYQGDTFELEVRLRDINADGTLGAYIDLTGSTIAAQARATKATAVLATFGVTIWDQTDPDLRGGLTLTLTNTQTAALPGDTSVLWDMQRTDSQGRVRTLLAGRVLLTGEVTR